MVHARRVVPAPPVVHLSAPPAPAVDVIVSMEERMARLETMFLANNQMYDHQYVYALNVANHEVRHVPCGCEGVKKLSDTIFQHSQTRARCGRFDAVRRFT